MSKKLVLKLISFYQNTRFFHGTIARQLFLTDQICRFRPTCSQYTYQAVEKYGTGKGLFLGLKRIVRCHPWSKGGFDPVK
jgi:uncharacterized protein